MDTGACALQHMSSCPDDMSTTEHAVYFFRGFCIPILLLIGIPSNFFIFAIFVRLQRRNACRFNIYVMYIAIAHEFQLICEGLLDHFIGRGLWYASSCTLAFKLDIQSQFACKFVSYLPAATECLAATLLVSFTIDRTVTVYRPIHSRGDIKLSWARLGVLGCFVFAFVSFIPAVIFYNVEVDQAGKCSCRLTDPTGPGARYVILMSVFCSYTIPTIIILLLNILICYKLKTVLQESAMQNTSRPNPEKRRILGHLGVCSFFLMLSTPLVICMLMRLYSDAQDLSHSAPKWHKEVVQLTKFFSSFTAIQYSLDIIIYLIFLPNVRSEAVRMLCGWPCLLRFGALQRFYSRHVRESSSEKKSRQFRRTTTNNANSSVRSVATNIGNGPEPAQTDDSSN